MVLSDRSIREAVTDKRIVITPFDPTSLQPSSYDVHLFCEFRVFDNFTTPYIDVQKQTADLTSKVAVREDRPFILHPGEFVLGSTVEYLELPNDLVARIEGKSSLGRLGLLIHSTAGYVDPGWKGQLTLELSNVANVPIALYAGMPIGQVSFLTMTTPVDHPYGTGEIKSKYQGQKGPVASKMHENF